MGRGLQFLLALAIATPRLVWPDVVISEDSECDKLLPPQRAGKACHVSSSQMASQLKESQLLPPHFNISARVRHELAAHLIRHPEIGMVTCDPLSPGRDKMINLFPYLRATLPITAKQVTCWLPEAQCQCDRRMRHCCSQKHHNGRFFHAKCLHRSTSSPAHPALSQTLICPFYPPPALPMPATERPRADQDGLQPLVLLRGSSDPWPGACPGRGVESAGQPGV